MPAMLNIPNYSAQKGDYFALEELTVQCQTALDNDTEAWMKPPLGKPCEQYHRVTGKQGTSSLQLVLRSSELRGSSAGHGPGPPSWCLHTSLTRSRESRRMVSASSRASVWSSALYLQYSSTAEAPLRANLGLLQAAGPPLDLWGWVCPSHKRITC